MDKLTLRLPLAALLLAGCCASAGAQAPEPQVVNVTGQLYRDLRPYSYYLPGVREFRQYHDLAPHADLRFGLVSGASGTPLPLKQARMESNGWGVDLPVVEEGWFTMPGAENDAHANADVVVSWRGGGAVTWTIDVHTAGLPYQVYRLGDLRLECRVNLAIQPAQWRGANVKDADRQPERHAPRRMAPTRSAAPVDATMEESHAARVMGLAAGSSLTMSEMAANSRAFGERVLARLSAQESSPMDAACGGPASVFFNAQPWPKLDAYVISEGGRKLRREMHGWDASKQSFELDLAPAAGAPAWSDDALVEFVFQDRSHWQEATP